jgi:hypothetical protein
LLSAAWLPSGAWAQNAQGTVTFTVVESPLDVIVRLPANASPGQWVDARVTVVNRGQVPLTAGRVRLTLEYRGRIVLMSERKFGRLAPGRSGTFKWRLKLDRPGTYRVVAEAGAVESPQRTHVNGDTAEINVAQGAVKLLVSRILSPLARLFKI